MLLRTLYTLPALLLRINCPETMEHPQRIFDFVQITYTGKQGNLMNWCFHFNFLTFVFLYKSN